MVILDQRLPKLSGTEVLAELRRLGNPKSVILISGYVEEEGLSRESALGDGAPGDRTEVMRKPFDGESLLREIERLRR